MIDRRAFLIKMELGKPRERGEPEDAFEARISFEIERLARRIIDDCAAMRCAPPQAFGQRAPRVLEQQDAPAGDGQADESAGA